MPWKVRMPSGLHAVFHLLRVRLAAHMADQANPSVHSSEVLGRPKLIKPAAAASLKSPPGKN